MRRVTKNYVETAVLVPDGKIMPDLAHGFRMFQLISSPMHVRWWNHFFYLFTLGSENVRNVIK